MERSINDYPIAIIEDRYDGIYSGGRWIAIAEADLPHEGSSRVSWALESGPSSDDLMAGLFWMTPPHWIAVGRTPDEALANLRARAEIA